MMQDGLCGVRTGSNVRVHKDQGKNLCILTRTTLEGCGRPREQIEEEKEGEREREREW